MADVAMRNTMALPVQCPLRCIYGILEWNSSADTEHIINKH